MKEYEQLRVSDIQIADIRRQAREFMEAARRCDPEPHLEGVRYGPVSAAVVCNVFAIELWLKALYCSANPTGSVPRGHDLMDLFRKLEQYIQDALIRWCGYSEPLFVEILTIDAKSFESWRYSYEHGAGALTPVAPLSVNVVLLRRLGDACDEIYKQFYQK